MNYLKRLRSVVNTQDSELCSQGAIVTCFSKALQYLINVKTVRADAKHLYLYLLRLIYSQDSGFESVALQQALVCLPVLWHCSARAGLAEPDSLFLVCCSPSGIWDCSFRNKNTQICMG